ncbi:hypothetical protein ACSZM9_22310, partial [Aeromonas hydrophila]|uniref:hypothetical protein n=1 Tax=Aeromonas hydrophila TaxID=644 RepID=UPI003EC7BF1F
MSRASISASAAARAASALAAASAAVVAVAVALLAALLGRFGDGLGCLLLHGGSGAASRLLDW